MVGIVLVSHSRALATAVKELVVSMAGPKLQIAIAAGAGEEHSELGTNGVEIAEAITSVMNHDGVFVLMDIGSALLSTDTALSLLDDAQRSRVRYGAAPFVEGAIAAGVQAALGGSLDEVDREALGALGQKQRHFGVDGEAAPVAELQAGAPAARTIRVAVPNPHGIHARPAARFIREAAAFDAEIQVSNITNTRGPVSARSLTGLASLEVLEGNEIEISATGPDAEVALRTLRKSVESGLGDSIAEPQSRTAPARYEPDDAPVPVSGGLVIGPLFFATSAAIDLPENRPEDPEAEVRRLHEALAAARSAIDAEQAALRKSLGRNEAEIFEAQAMVLEDPALLRRAEASIHEGRENAALAWAHACHDVAAEYAHLEDEYLRQRAADIRDIGARVLAALGVARPRVGDLPQPGILVVDDLAPAEIMTLPEAVLGVICLQGGRTSHAAILLRARGVPAIARAQAAFEHVLFEKAVAAFDGATGELWINPDSAHMETLRARAKTERVAADEAARLSHEGAVTRDGHAIHVYANLGSAAEAALALERGADGVGLFRTEFLFLDRVAAPDEEEQFDCFRRLCEAMGTRPVIVRTFDVGGDKPAPYLGLAREANPFLGMRGIRVCLERPELFQTHLRAILRGGLGGNFRIMFPMVAEVGELRAGRAAVEEAHRSLDQAGVAHAWPVPVGVMIEVPSAVIMGDQLAEEADFFSIGTNDLAQYVLAADRGNPNLTRFQNAQHPSVMRMIVLITTEAHRRGKQVGVCGEAAGDTWTAQLMIGLGVDELSVGPALIPGIKAAIRAARKGDLEALAAKAQER
jgi:phosphocarrier protein FPr